MNSSVVFFGIGAICSAICPKYLVSHAGRIRSSCIGEVSNNSSIVEYSSLESYLAAKYNTTLSLSAYGRLSEMPTTAYQDGYVQWDESVYVKPVDGGSYSEGNCGLVSMSNILAYFSRYEGKVNFPSYDDITLVYPYSQPQYFNTVFSYGYTPKASEVQIHSIYAKMREYAMSQGYLVGGMNDSTTGYSFISTSSYYGYTATYSCYSEYTFGRSTVIMEIDNNRPIQLRTLGDSVYGSHGMMITGYKTFTGTYFYPYGMGVSVTIFVVSVLDSWSSTERWYDIEQLSDYPFPSGRHRSEGVTIATVTMN